MTDTPASIEQRALEVMEKYGLADDDAPDLPEPEFADVTAALDDLRRAVDDVVAADRAQVGQVLGVLRGQFPSVHAMVMQQVTDLADGIVSGIGERLDAVRQLVDERLRPHAEVPAKLETERDLGRDRAERLSGIASRISELTDDEAWTGEAADGYRRAVVVQGKALSELSGIEQSSANALDRSALLNRASFFYASEAISFTASRIRGLHTGDATQLLLRTRTIDGHLRVLVGKLGHELDAVAAGEPATSLAADLERLLGMPRVLGATDWPTGAAAADVPPAPTHDVVAALD